MISRLPGSSLPPDRAARALAVLVLCAAFGGAQARGAPEVLRLDPARSRITFVLDAGMHDVEGSARLTHGTIRFDLATGAADGEVVADARSADTASKSRDKKMHAEVLESAAHPQIAFYPERIEGTLLPGAEGEVRIRGIFLLHGDRHSLELTARAKRDGGSLAGTARFVIPYVAWGLEDPSVFVLRVHKEVNVTLEFAGTLEDGRPTGPPPTTH